MSIFLQAYTSSDFFGKLIFIALFALSITCWTILIRKFLVLKSIQKKGQNSLQTLQQKNFHSMLFNQEHTDSNPFSNTLSAISSKTSQLLKKNGHFKDCDAVFLSKRDIHTIDEFSSMTIYQEVANLGSDLFILSTIVSLAPFLGILGTVWGILLSLGELQQASQASNTIVLAGLSTALATTVLGLVIAIPALIGYNYLKNSLSSIGSNLEGFSHSIVQQLELQYREVEVT